MLNLVPTDTPVSSNLCRSIDPSRIVTKRVVTSGVVYPKPLWLCWAKIYCGSISQWVVPDEIQDPDSEWFSEPCAADENLATVAVTEIDYNEVTGYLVGILSTSHKVTGIAVYPYFGSIVDMRLYFSVWDGAVWIDFGRDICPDGEWSEYLFSGEYVTDKIAVRLTHREGGGPYLAGIYELRFIARVDTYLQLKNGFSSNAGILFELDPAGRRSECVVFTKPIRFNKGLFASFGPVGSYAEFGYVPDY